MANEQTVDEAAGTVDNRVTLTLNKQKIDIRVFGAARHPRPTNDDDTLEQMLRRAPATTKESAAKSLDLPRSAIYPTVQGRAVPAATGGDASSRPSSTTT